MAQHLIEAERIGHQLIPALTGQRAAQYGAWFIRWAQENPENALQLARDTIHWLRQNAPEIGEQAWHLAQGATERSVQILQNAREEWTDLNRYVRGETQRLHPTLEFPPRTGIQNRDRARLDSRHETTLDELMPDTSENTMETTSRPTPAQPEAAAARVSASSSGGNNPVSKETPISEYPSLSYGLQETHTTVLPWTGWISAVALDKETPAQLKIRMNSPYDMLDMSTIDHGATDGAKYTVKGFSRRPIDIDGRYSTSGNIRFPTEFSNNATEATETPQWREYWAKLYDYYTVLACEYEIILYNPIQARQQRLLPVPTKTLGTITYPSTMYVQDMGFFNTDCVVGLQYDSYSATATTTGNVMPVTKYEEVRAFKNIQWYPVPGGQKTVIRGQYKPGTIKRNIVNDGDVKTWTATGSAPPSLSEILTLNFWTDPFFNAREPDVYGTAGGGTNTEPSATGSAMLGGLNMEINLKYIVQFKDLKLQARYPNTLITNQDIVQTLNETVTDPGNPLMRWT